MTHTSSSHLGDLERDIMDVLWKRTGATVREVVSELHEKRRSAYTTVMTVMNRLVDKGLLVRKTQGSCYCYAATQLREQYMASASHRVIDELIRSYGSIAVTAFLDTLDISDPQLIKRLSQRFGKDHASG